MIVAAWNTQRATNLDSTNFYSAGRAGYVLAVVKSLLSFHKDWRPELIFLSEVTQKGDTLADALNTDLARHRYTATFHENADMNDDVSPCSFLLIRSDSLKISATTDIEAHGGSTQRPYLLVKVKSHGWVFAGVHIKANRSESFDEIVTMLTDLGTQQAVCMIGDMNFEYADIARLSQAERKQLTDTGFTAYDPNMKCTFVSSRSSPDTSTSKIDFAFVTSAQRHVTALPQPYTDWKIIDHAPILYYVPARELMDMEDE